jgi:hypothetical protein
MSKWMAHFESVPHCGHGLIVVAINLPAVRFDTATAFHVAIDHWREHAAMACVSGASLGRRIVVRADNSALPVKTQVCHRDMLA